MLPVVAAHGSDGIGKSRMGFGIPGSLEHGDLVAPGQTRGEKGHPGEQTEQDGAGASDGEIGPLTLGFKTEVSTNFLEGDLDAPTEDEPGEDWLGGLVGIGA